MKPSGVIKLPAAIVGARRTWDRGSSGEIAVE
jgi:hypothetical protein